MKGTVNPSAIAESISLILIRETYLQWQNTRHSAVPFPHNNVLSGSENWIMQELRMLTPPTQN